MKGNDGPTQRSRRSSMRGNEGPTQRGRRSRMRGSNGGTSAMENSSDSDVERDSSVVAAVEHPGSSAVEMIRGGSCQQVKSYRSPRRRRRTSMRVVDKKAMASVRGKSDTISHQPGGGSAICNIQKNYPKPTRRCRKQSVGNVIKTNAQLLGNAVDETIHTRRRRLSTASSVVIDQNHKLNSLLRFVQHNDAERVNLLHIAMSAAEVCHHPHKALCVPCVLGVDVFCT